MATMIADVFRNWTSVEWVNHTADVASECPLAGEHLRQGMERLAGGPLIIQHVSHPIQLMAHAYGLETD